MHIIRECMETRYGVNETRCGGRFGVPYDNRIPPHHMLMAKFTCYKRTQPAIKLLYETQTVPMTSSHMTKLEGTEMKMCR